MPFSYLCRLLSGATLVAGLTLACAPGDASVGDGGAVDAEAPAPQRLVVRVVGEHPHDPGSYTQGLLWHEGSVFESRGRHGESGVRRYRLDGTVEADVELEDAYFGEGLALVGQQLYQLTWQEGTLFVYDASDLRRVERLPYRGEGWGLAFDGESLIASDGTHVLVFLDPATLEIRRRLVVRQQGSLRDSLNELEYVDGAIWANVYQTDDIVRIDPATGAVTAVVDAAGLLSAQEADERAEVLNGIAWRADTGTFLVTGKYWPKMFEVSFEPSSEADGGSE